MCRRFKIPLCKHCEIRKDSQKYEQRPGKIVKKSVFSKMKLACLLMKKRA